MPRNAELNRLRSQRSRAHRALGQAEALVAGYQAKVAELEAAIHALAPGLQLHPRRYRPNPVFARGELPRLTLAIMRDAGEPLPTRVIAARALAMKGVLEPTPQVRDLTRLRLQQTFVKWNRRGMIVTVGVGNAGRRMLAQGLEALPKTRIVVPA